MDYFYTAPAPVHFKYMKKSGQQILQYIFFCIPLKAHEGFAPKMSKYIFYFFIFFWAIYLFKYFPSHRNDTAESESSGHVSCDFTHGCTT